MSFIYALSDNRWSNAGTTYRGIWMDFTNGSGGSAVGAAASRPLRLSNNGTDFFGIDLNGQLFLDANGAVSQPRISGGNSAVGWFFGSGGVRFLWTYAGNVPVGLFGDQYWAGTSGFSYAWTASGTDVGAAPPDTHLSRRRAAVVSVNGAFAVPSLTLASLSASVATAASAGAGAIAYINDGLAPVLNATAAGGGTVPCIVHSDGTQWRT